MSRRYTYGATLEFGSEDAGTHCELDVEVSFTVAWGSPATGHYGPPEHYDPGSGDAVEDLRVEKVSGHPRPWSLGLGYLPDADFAKQVIERLEADDERLQWMIESAAEEEAGFREDAMERRYER